MRKTRTRRWNAPPWWNTALECLGNGLMGFARLDCTKPPQGYPLPRWNQIINDGGLFLDQWAHQAAAFGWTALDVFGVNPAAPLVRYDGMGLVPLIQGCRVISIAADSAQIKTSSGNTQTYSRRPRLDAVCASSEHLGQMRG